MAALEASAQSGRLVQTVAAVARRGSAALARRIRSSRRCQSQGLDWSGHGGGRVDCGLCGRGIPPGRPWHRGRHRRGEPGTDRAGGVAAVPAERFLGSADEGQSHASRAEQDPFGSCAGVRALAAGSRGHARESGFRRSAVQPGCCRRARRRQFQVDVGPEPGPRYCSERCLVSGRAAQSGFSGRSLQCAFQGRTGRSRSASQSSGIP
jgi:hypothetical protein